MEVIGNKPVMDIKKVKAEAENEFREEREKKAKKLLIELYKKQEQAKQVLRNIEREIADALAEIEQGNIA
jgi:ABC-type enterochelin transport system substrate-binding protein